MGCYRKQVGANPLEFVTRTTGMLTLVFLLDFVGGFAVATDNGRQLADEVPPDARSVRFLLWLAASFDLRSV